MSNITRVFWATLLILLYKNMLAQTIKQEVFSTHLRLSFNVKENDCYITKKDDVLEITFYNKELFQEVVSDFNNIVFDKKYILKKTPLSDLSKFQLYYTQKDIDVFVFYLKSDVKYIVDLWMKQKSTIDSVNKKTKNIKKQIIVKKEDKGARIEIVNDEKKELMETNDESSWRDFRYGAAFFWNYSAFIPDFPIKIDLNSKTPEFWYPVQNLKESDIKKSVDLGELQLIINYFKSATWGLMAKAIEIYQEKYGYEKNADLFDFMKATVLLKKNFSINNKEGINSEIKMAVALYQDVFSRSNDASLKEAILRYLVNFYNETGDYVALLDYSKKFYFVSKNNFDSELEILAIEAILYSFSKLNQDDEIEKFSEEKNIKELVSRQSVLAYLSGVYLNRDRSQDIIKLYEKYGPILKNDINEYFLYNTAEAYFRLAKYKESLELFSKFLNLYSYTAPSNMARVRIALCFDLLNYNKNLVLQKYEEAINRTSKAYYRYEAKIRYVGLLIGRKRKLIEDDYEKLVFLEHTDEEEKVLDHNLKKILWLVRLRSFIVRGDYPKALLYLKAIPSHLFVSTDMRAFYADGSEIIHGLMNIAFNEMKYGQVIQYWEEYRDTYFDKTTVNPDVFFYVAISYMKIGFFDKAQEIIKYLRSKNSVYFSYYPKWINENDNNINVSQMVLELELKWEIIQERYDGALKKCVEIQESKTNNNKIDYYIGLSYYGKNEYKLARDYLQKFIINKDDGLLLTNEEIYSMTLAYVESLYQLEKGEKYIQIVNAILKDLKMLKSPVMKKLRERVEYLLIEKYYEEESKKNSNEILKRVKSYKNEFNSSIYLGRLSYINSVALIRLGKKDEAEKELLVLINNSMTPQYVKEVAKMELSSLKMKKFDQ